MRLSWFVRKGPLFLPISWPGWMILLAALAYVVWAFLDIDSRSHSVSDTLINTMFNALIAGVVYAVIAFLTSRGEETAQ